MALFVSDITSACFCMISRHYQVYSSTTEYQRASLTILPTGNYNLPFMGHKIPYLSSLLVTCHQSSRLYGVWEQNFSTSGTISLRITFSVMWRQWDAALSCRSEQCGGTYLLLSLHGHGRPCRSWLKNIVIFTLFCDILDQVWSLRSIWKIWTLNVP